MSKHQKLVVPNNILQAFHKSSNLTEIKLVNNFLKSASLLFEHNL